MLNIYSAFWDCLLQLLKMLSTQSCNFVFLTDFQMLLVCEVDVSYTSLYDPKCPRVSPWSAHLRAQYKLHREPSGTSVLISQIIQSVADPLEECSAVNGAAML